MEKKITSKNTSINRDRVPAIYSKLAKQGVYGTHIFDIGCGKWTRHIKKFAKDNCMCADWYGFDPYNQDKLHNARVNEIVENEYFFNNNPNVFISSNVLNVIKDGRREHLQSILRRMKAIDELYITVYEGDKSGIGRMTSKDCWQENRKLKTYFEEVEQAYRDTHTAEFMEGETKHCIDIKYGMIRVLPSYNYK